MCVNRSLHSSRRINFQLLQHSLRNLLRLSRSTSRFSKNSKSSRPSRSSKSSRSSRSSRPPRPSRFFRSSRDPQCLSTEKPSSSCIRNLFQLILKNITYLLTSDSLLLSFDNSSILKEKDSRKRSLKLQRRKTRKNKFY